MNSEEARQWLEVFRPGGEDMNDPRFVEALLQSERDPELGKWFVEQRRFDVAMTQSLKAGVPVAAEWREAVLSNRKTIRPPLWQDWRARAAVAASVAFLAVSGGLLLNGRTVEFSEFRSDLVEEAWDGKAHLDLESSDPVRLNQWLASNNLPADFSIPEGLREARMLGCRVVQADGGRVPMFCLVDGHRHLHLFVLSDMQMTRLPPDNIPDFEKCGAWKTVSWHHENKTYVLTGLKYQTFLAKFRKGGRWTMSG